MKPALLFGGDYNAFALWSCRPRGTGEEPRLSFAAWLRAGWRLFRGLEKTEGLGGGKRGRKARSYSPPREEGWPRSGRGGRSRAKFGASDHPVCGWSV